MRDQAHASMSFRSEVDDAVYKHAHVEEEFGAERVVEGAEGQREARELSKVSVGVPG